MPIQLQVVSDSEKARKDLAALKAAINNIKNVADNFSFNPFSGKAADNTKAANKALKEISTTSKQVGANFKDIGSAAQNATGPIKGISANYLTASRAATEMAIQSKNAGVAIEGSVKNAEKFSGVAQQITGQIKSMAIAAVAFAGGFASISGGIKVSDTLTQMESKLRIATNSQREFNDALKESRRAALETRVGVVAITDLYAKISKSTEGFGRSQEEVSQVTRNVAKALAASGASAENAQAAVLQLGQALSSGVLRGDELNSIMENAPALANAIAAGLGKTTGQLRTLGSEGKLVSREVFRAILAQTDALDSNFKKAGVTFSQAFENMNNSGLLLASSLGRIFSGGGGGVGGAASLKKGIPDLINGIALKIAQFAEDLGYYVLHMKTEVLLAISELKSYLNEPLDIKFSIKKLGLSDIFPDLSGIKAFFEPAIDFLKRSFSMITKDAFKPKSMQTSLSEDNSPPTGPTLDINSKLGVITTILPLLVAGIAALTILPTKLAAAVKVGIALTAVTAIGNHASAAMGEKANQNSLSELSLATLPMAIASAVYGAIRVLTANIPTGIMLAFTAVTEKVGLTRLAGFMPILSFFLNKTVGYLSLISGVIAGIGALLISNFQLPSAKMESTVTSLTSNDVKDSMDETVGFIGNTLSKIATFAWNALKATAISIGSMISTVAFGMEKVIASISRVFPAFGVAVTKFKLIAGIGDYAAQGGDGPQRNSKNRMFGHDVLNTLVPEKLQIPAIATVTAGIAAVIAITTTGGFRSVLLGLLTTAMGLVIGGGVYDREISRVQGILTKTGLDIVHGITDALFGSGIFGDRGFGGTLALIAKMMLLFSAGREYVLKGLGAAVTAPTTMAQSAATGLQSFAASKWYAYNNKNLEALTTLGKTLKDQQKDAVNNLAASANPANVLSTKGESAAMAAAINKFRKLNDNAAVASSIASGTASPNYRVTGGGFDRLAESAMKATARMNDYNTITARGIETMKANVEILKSHSEALKKQVDERTKAFKEGVVNTAGGIGGIFGTLGGFNLGRQIADGMVGASDWQKVGVTMGMALAGQALGAFAGSTGASAFMGLAGWLSTAIIAAITSPITLAIAGFASIFAIYANWDWFEAQFPKWQALAKGWFDYLVGLGDLWAARISGSFERDGDTMKQIDANVMGQHTIVAALQKGVESGSMGPMTVKILTEQLAVMRADHATMEKKLASESTWVKLFYKGSMVRADAGVPVLPKNMVQGVIGDTTAKAKAAVSTAITPTTALVVDGTNQEFLTALFKVQQRVESNNNPNAVSPKGALGLMQTMPTTLTDPGYGVKPAQNMSPEELQRVGKDYMVAMLAKYENNLSDALGAYNWGPGAMDKWKRNGSKPEMMPDETKKYISKISAKLGNPSTIPASSGAAKAAPTKMASVGDSIKTMMEALLEYLPENIRVAVRKALGGSSGNPLGDTKEAFADSLNKILDTKYTGDQVAGLDFDGIAASIKEFTDATKAAFKNGQPTELVGLQLDKRLADIKAGIADSIAGPKVEKKEKTGPIADSIANFADMQTAIQRVGGALSEADFSKLSATDMKRLSTLIADEARLAQEAAKASDSMKVWLDRQLQDTRDTIKNIVDSTKPIPAKNARGNSSEGQAAGDAFAAQFQTSMTSGFADFLKGKTAFASFGQMLLDNFTNGVVDAFSKGVVDKLFKSMKLDSIFSDAIAGVFDFGTVTADVVFKSAADTFAAAVDRFAGAPGVSAKEAFRKSELLAQGGNASIRLGTGDEQLAMADKFGLDPLGEQAQMLADQEAGFNDVTDATKGGSKSVVSSIATLGTVLTNPLNSMLTMLSMSSMGGGVSGGGGIMGVLSGVGKGITGALEGAGNWLTGLFSMDVGGTVPGGFGQPMPILAHGGEVILNPRQQQELLTSGGGGQSKGSLQQVFNINVTGDISKQTRMEIQQMIPQIATGVNMHNYENGRR